MKYLSSYELLAALGWRGLKVLGLWTVPMIWLFVAGPLPRWRGLKDCWLAKPGLARSDVAGPLPRWRGLKGKEPLRFMFANSGCRAIAPLEGTERLCVKWFEIA